jgi:hypothetical protein
MADMIDAKEAKNQLGCDDATLNGYINGGSIRAQRVAGKLMLNADDVAKIKGDDDGTIVLTGDSDEMSIDLGKVVDDASETIIQPRKDASGSASESITFGDDLEVVSFDDGNTKDLNYDKTRATSGLSFTDSNTAVMTAVDETAVGGTTGPVEFATSQVDSGPAGTASRRSVRSARTRGIEEVKTHWSWVVVMALTVVIAGLFILPYYFMILMPHPTNTKDYAGNVLRGLDDNGWTNFASSVAKFSVEPDAEKFKATRDTGEFIDIATVDPQAKWRKKEYYGAAKPGDRVKDFVIVEIQAEGRKAKAESGELTYDVHDDKVDLGAEKGSITEQKIDLNFPKQ